MVINICLKCKEKHKHNEKKIEKEDQLELLEMEDVVSEIKNSLK